jgi:hypothetical protein
MSTEAKSRDTTEFGSELIIRSRKGYAAVALPPMQAVREGWK